MSSEYVKIRRKKLDALKDELHKKIVSLGQAQELINLMIPKIEVKHFEPGSKDGEGREITEPEMHVFLDLMNYRYGVRFNRAEVEKEGAEQICIKLGAIGAQKLLGPHLSTLLMQNVAGKLNSLVPLSNSKSEDLQTNVEIHKNSDDRSISP